MDLCRVQKPCHMANKPMFTVCQSQGTRQTFELCRVPRLQAHGKGGRHVTSQVFCFFCRGSALAHGKGFAVCPINGTRQTTPLPMSECCVLFAVCGTRQSLCRVYIGLCRVHIGLCHVLWHTSKQQSPVARAPVCAGTALVCGRLAAAAGFPSAEAAAAAAPSHQ